jgi:hypothetical protein
MDLRTAVKLLPTPQANPIGHYKSEKARRSSTEGGQSSRRGSGRCWKRLRIVSVEWGEYEPAIRRWEAIHGPAPEPLIRRLDDGDAKLRRVRARVDRSRLSALGDGVHVYLGRLIGDALHELERGGVKLLPTPSAVAYGNNQSPSEGAAVRPSLENLMRG